MLYLAGYSLAPIMALLVSEFVATLHTPRPATRSAILHFAAGLVLAVVAVEFLPDLLHQHSAWVTAFAFTLGTAAMLLSGKRRNIRSSTDNRCRHPSRVTRSSSY